MSKRHKGSTASRGLSSKAQRKITDSYQSFVRAQTAKLRNFPNIPESEVVSSSMLSILQLLFGSRIRSEPLSWDEFIDIMQDSDTLAVRNAKDIYERFLSGFVYDEDFCEAASKIFGIKHEFKKFNPETYGVADWRVAYAVVTLLSMGLSMWENIAECDAICDVVAYLAYGLDISDFESLHLISGHNCSNIDDAMFMLSHKFKGSTPVETTLFADLPILYESGTFSKSLYGLALINLRKGKSSVVTDLVHKYVVYLPACINKTSKYLLRPEYQSRRRDLYKHYGDLVDTAMVAFSYGVLAVYDYLEQAHDLGYLVEKKYIDWYRNYISEYEATCKNKIEESKSGNGYVDAMYLFEKQKSRGVLIERFIPRWQTNICNRDDVDISSYSIPDVVLDNWISANMDSKYAYDLWMPVRENAWIDSTLCSFTFPMEHLKRFDMLCPASVETLAAAWYMCYIPAKALRNRNEVKNLETDKSKLSDENEKLRNRIKKLQEEKDKYKIQVQLERRESTEKVEKKTEELRTSLVSANEQIASLERQLETMSDKLMSKTRECSNLTKDMKKLNAVRAEGYDNDSESDEELKPVEPSFEMKVSRLCKYKYLFIRGNQVMIEKLTNLGFTNVVNLNEFEDRRTGIKFDHMVICTDKIAHKFRWWAQTQTSSSNGKTLYYSGSNVEALVDLLYEEIVD